MWRAVSIFVLVSGLSGADDSLDRVVAAAGQRVVTLSAVRRQLRLDALANHTPLVDTPAARRDAAARLVDQMLLRSEIELSRYTAPPMAEAEATIETFLGERKVRSEEWLSTLERNGFSEDDFKREVLWRITVARFLEYRFAPGVQVSDEEISGFYQREFLPQFARESPAQAAPRLDDVREKIVRVLIVRRTNVAVDQWLAQTRIQMKVRLFEEALQ